MGNKIAALTVTALLAGGALAATSFTSIGSEHAWSTSDVATAVPGNQYQDIAPQGSPRTTGTPSPPPKSESSVSLLSPAPALGLRSRMAKVTGPRISGSGTGRVSGADRL